MEISTVGNATILVAIRDRYLNWNDYNDNSYSPLISRQKQLNEKSLITQMKEYLQASEIINWRDSNILELSEKIAFKHSNQKAIAKACFEWVRDEIHHSFDYQMNPVTCRASDVLKYKTGYCYAKSHLLAALLRANGIPTGFCYQRLSINDQGAPYCLHGLNAIYLPDFGWYRIDSRGNREGINAQFTPPQEQLAYKIRIPKEADFPGILAEPLLVVVKALQTYKTWDEMLANLPDISPEAWKLGI